MNNNTRYSNLININFFTISQYQKGLTRIITYLGLSYHNHILKCHSLLRNNILTTIVDYG